MNRQPTTLPKEAVPSVFHGFLEGAVVYDSSCSPEARVWFLDKGTGFFLKRNRKGGLKKEAALNDYFYRKGLGAEVLAYESLDEDWMLTRRVPGEDCTDRLYLEDPKGLCDKTAELLRMLHETDFAGCPVPDRTGDYLETVRRNHEAGHFDLCLFSGAWCYDSAEAAWSRVEKEGRYLKADTLLHGDYCLPNIILDRWQFSGFIDLDSAGVGDKHIDLFWGIWSLEFNLKTDRYRDRFLDAYGRESICEDVFPLIAAAEVFG